MGIFQYENEGTATYLVYALTEQDVLDSMSLGMLINNTIPGLAPTLFTQMNMTKYIKYEISAKIAASKLFIGAVNKKRLVGVFTGIVNALLSAEDYMIDTRSIVLDLDYIFADVSTCETQLICLPVINENTGNVNLGAFFKNIVFNIQSDQTENCDYVAKIINYLNGSPQFSLADFKKVLDDISRSVGSSNVGGYQTRDAHPAKKSHSNNGDYSNQTQTVNVQPSANRLSQQQVMQQQVIPQQVSQQQVVQQQVIPQSTVQQQIPQQPVQQQFIQPQKKEKKKKSQSTIQAEQPVLAPGEKPITMFGLLMHYNKENAAKYKAQKAAKKAQTNSNTQTAQQQTQGQTQTQAQKNRFAIPGQQNQSFAIPGQENTPSRVVTPTQNNSTVNNYVSQQPIVQQPVVQQVQPVSQGYNPNTSYTENSTDFGPTTVLGGTEDGKTAVLSDIPAYGAESVKKPVLIRVRNNERIPIDKPYFRIGKEKSYVDYFIGDNSYISRGHASIITKDGHYYIVDNNSRNHTYVNGEIITSSTEVEIRNGDAIKLANEEFEFKLF